MASKKNVKLPTQGDQLPRVHLSDGDLQKIVSEARKRPRWYDVGAFVALISLAAFLLYEASSAHTDQLGDKLDLTSKEIIDRLESLEQDTQKYDPIFRSTLLARTRSVLHGVRVNDIENHTTQSRLQEILVSLDRSGAFKNSRHGWLTLLALLVRDLPASVEATPYSGKSYEERLRILENWSAVPSSEREVGVVEQCYLETFSSLLQLKKFLAKAGVFASDSLSYDGLRPARPLAEIADRLTRVARICPDLPNAHNGLGVYWLELAERTGDSAQFDVAQRYFTFAFQMGLASSVDRGLVFGTYANNVASVTIARTYMSALPTVRRGEDWYFGSLPTLGRLRAVRKDLESASLDLQSTDGINTSAAIHLLTRAEVNMLLALLDRAIKHPEIPIAFSPEDGNLVQAMEHLRQARFHGFEDWCYFFSKDWNKMTILATPALNAQVSGWCTF